MNDYKSRLSLDSSQHDSALKKSGDEIKKYGDKVKQSNEDVRKLIEQQRKAKKQYEANQKALHQYGLSMNDFKGQLTGAIKGYVGFAAAAAAFSAALKYNVETAKKFEKSISGLKALTGLGGQDLDYLKDKAIELGSKTTQSASEVVEAFKTIGSQKPELLKTKEALVSVTKAAITLSEASGIEMAEASKALTMALNQMGAGASHAKEYINILAAASKEGAADIPYLTKAIEKCGSMASSSKIPFNQLIATIESVAPKFSSADVAGSQLNSTLLKLSTQTNNNYKPAVVGLQKAIENLAKAEMTDKELKDLVGESNVSMVKALIAAREENERLTKAITGTNTAEEQAKINTDNFEGSIKNLESAWEGFNLRLNESNGIFKRIVDNLTEAVKLAGNLAKYGFKGGIANYWAEGYEENGNGAFSKQWLQKGMQMRGLNAALTEEDVEEIRKKLIDDALRAKKSINTDSWSDIRKRALDKAYLDAIDTINEEAQARKDVIKEEDKFTTATTVTTKETNNTTKKLSDLEKAIAAFKTSLKNARARTNALTVFKDLTNMSDVDFYSEQLSIVSQELNAYKQKLEDVGDLTDEEKKRVTELNNERKKLTQKLKREQEVQRYKEDYQKRTNPQNITNALFGNGKYLEEGLTTYLDEITKLISSDSTKARVIKDNRKLENLRIEFLTPKRSWEGWQNIPDFNKPDTWKFDTNSQIFKQYADEWVQWYQSVLKFETDIEDEIRNYLLGKLRFNKITSQEYKEIGEKLFSIPDLVEYFDGNPKLKEIGEVIVSAIANKEFIHQELEKFNSNPRSKHFREQIFGSYQNGLSEQINDVRKQQGQIELEKFRIPQDITDSVIGYGNAWKSYFELMNSEDATAWDGLTGMIEVLQSSIDMVMNLINQMERYSELSKQFVAAKEAENALTQQSTAAKAAETGAALGLMSAESGEAIAGATASGAKLPFPYNIAAIAAGVSAVISAIGMIASLGKHANGGIIPKFADGGVFQGHSNLGDMNLARVNGGEMILNGSQQERLFRMLNSNGGYNSSPEGNVTFRIEGSQLVGVLSNYQKKHNKIL